MTDDVAGDAGPMEAKGLFWASALFSVLSLVSGSVGVAWWVGWIQLSGLAVVLVWCAFGVSLLLTLGLGQVTIACQTGNLTSMPLLIAIWGPVLFGWTPPGFIFTGLSAYKLFRGKFPDTTWSERSGGGYSSHQAEAEQFGRAGIPVAVVMVALTYLLPFVWVKIFTG